jgi:tetratricopeptide (TPR) repeat protein
MNTDDCSDITRSRLFQLLGRLSSSEGKYDKAKAEFSKAIYYSSRSFGAESVSTSICYFRLGEVFVALGSSESAFSFFDKVVDIWYKYLTSLLGRVETVSAAGDEPAQSTEQLNEEHLADGRSQLQAVFDHRRQVLGINHIATGEVQFTLGLFEHFLLGNQVAAESYMTSAAVVYESQLGTQHASTKHVESILAIVKGPSGNVNKSEFSQFASSNEFDESGVLLSAPEAD